MSIGNRFPRNFFSSCRKLAFLTSSESLVVYSKRPEMRLIGRHLFIFAFLILQISKTLGSKMVYPEETQVTHQTFEYETPVTAMSQFDFFGQTFDLNLLQYFKKSITSTIMVSKVFWGPWSQLTSQNNLQSNASPLCYYLSTPTSKNIGNTSTFHSNQWSMSRTLLPHSIISTRVAIKEPLNLCTH